MKSLKRFPNYQITNSTHDAFSVMKEGQIIKQLRSYMKKTFAMTVLEAANSTSSRRSKKRNMKFPRTTEMSLLKYVMNCVLLQLLLDTKYSKAGLKRWHVQHRHYGCGSIGWMFEDRIYLGRLGMVDYLDATCWNRVTKVGNQLALCI